MSTKDFLEDTTGVSHVIGVILMISITTVLASFAGMFLFGIADGLSDEPRAAMDFTYQADTSTYDGPPNGAGDCRGNLGNPSEGQLIIEVAASDPIDANNVEIIGHRGDPVGFAACSPDVNPGDSLSPGDEAYVGITDDDTVRLIWTNDDGDRGTTLGKWTPPID